MPIYAYRCTSCGHAKDVLQKVSDTLLTDCPACGAATFAKQLTAAGFQLKGSGWYATDFRGGNNGSGKPESEAGDTAGAEKTQDKAADKTADKATEKGTEKGARGGESAAPAQPGKAAAPSPSSAPSTPSAPSAPAAPATASPPPSGG